MEQNSLDGLMNGWSLRFVDDECEALYRKERRSLKRIPKQITTFFLIVIVTVVFLTALDLLGAFVWSPNYDYDAFDVVGVTFYIPVLAIEFLLYKFRCVPWVRGTFFTIILYFSLFYSTLSYYAPKFDYPVVSPL